MRCGFVLALNPADQLRLSFSLIQLKMAAAERLEKFFFLKNKEKKILTGIGWNWSLFMTRALNMECDIIQTWFQWAAMWKRQLTSCCYFHINATATALRSDIIGWRLLQLFYQDIQRYGKKMLYNWTKKRQSLIIPLGKKKITFYLNSIKKKHANNKRNDITRGRERRMKRSNKFY